MSQTDERQAGFWLRLALTALIVTVPWAWSLVYYEMSLAVVLGAVTLSGVATLLVWDGTRVPRALIGWLRGEPLRDRSTGLYNPEAWADLLTAEEDRCRRYELPASVVVVKVSGGEDAGSRAAPALQRVSRAHDVVACLTPDTFGVLAINAKATEPLVGRLRSALQAQSLLASFGVADRSDGRTLTDAWHEAERRVLQ